MFVTYFYIVHTSAVNEQMTVRKSIEHQPLKKKKRFRVKYQTFYTIIKLAHQWRNLYTTIETSTIMFDTNSIKSEFIYTLVHTICMGL